MQILILFFLLWLFGPASWINRVSTNNELIVEASVAYNSKNYKLAASKYGYIIDTLGFKNDAVLMNYGHSLYLTKSSKRAEIVYKELLNSSSEVFRSLAWNQLGMISRNNQNQALLYFKKALLEYADNSVARYNFELMLSLGAEMPVDVQDKKDRVKNEQNKSSGSRKKPSSDENDAGKNGSSRKPVGEGVDKSGRGVKKEIGKGNAEGQSSINRDGVSLGKVKREDQVLNRVPLDEMGMSMEQALQVLDAMQANEIQYLQQQKRGKALSKAEMNSKPRY